MTQIPYVMTPTPWIEHNAGFLHAMANRLGISLESAALEIGTIDNLDYRKAVLACAGCMDKDFCIGFTQSSSCVQSCPAFCRNKSILNTLANRDMRPEQYMLAGE